MRIKKRELFSFILFYAWDIPKYVSATRRIVETRVKKTPFETLRTLRVLIPSSCHLHLGTSTIQLEISRLHGNNHSCRSSLFISLSPSSKLRFWGCCLSIKRCMAILLEPTIHARPLSKSSSPWNNESFIFWRLSFSYLQTKELG